MPSRETKLRTNSGGWVKIDVRETVIHWLKNPEANLGLTISAKSATYQRNIPVGILHTNSNTVIKYSSNSQEFSFGYLIIQITVKYQIVPAGTILYFTFQVRVLIEGGHYSRAGTIIRFTVLLARNCRFHGTSTRFQILSFENQSILIRMKRYTHS